MNEIEAALGPVHARSAEKYTPTRLAASIGAAVILVASVGFWSATPAMAKCNTTGRGNNGVTYFDGWYRSPATTVGGVYSTILTYSPWVYSGSVVASWVMLNNDGLNWAQVGWWELSGNVRNTFVQWTTSPGHASTKTWAPKSIGSYYKYTTLYNNTPGKFTFQVADSTIDTETASFTPNEAQVFGEIHTLGSQMPGAVQDHETFGSTNVDIGGWQAFNGTDYNSSSTYFGATHVSSTVFHIWDKTCTGF
jgi:hypothetical protein